MVTFKMANCVLLESRRGKLVITDNKEEQPMDKQTAIENKEKSKTMVNGQSKKGARQ